MTPTAPKGPKPSKSTGAHPIAPRFSSVAIVVANRRDAVEWYTHTLGLDHLVDDDHWQTVGRKGSDASLHLCQADESGTDGKLEPGNTGIAMRLPGDFVKACAALEDRGVRFSSPATKYEWGWGASIQDPDGNEIYLAPEP